MVATIQPVSVGSFNDLEGGCIRFVAADEDGAGQYMLLQPAQQGAGNALTAAGGAGIVTYVAKPLRRGRVVAVA